MYYNAVTCPECGNIIEVDESSDFNCCEICEYNIGIGFSDDKWVRKKE